MPDFTIRVAGDDLIFSASHFITFEDGGCEALHGHDFYVAVEAHGPLNPSQYVLDFVVLREIVTNILKELDQRVLIPRDHPRIDLRTIGKELEVSLGGAAGCCPRTIACF